MHTCRGCTFELAEVGHLGVVVEPAALELAAAVGRGGDAVGGALHDAHLCTHVVHAQARVR